MKTLYQILEAQQELYHFTDGGSLARILKTDTFHASGDDGYNPNKNYGWYMSTTRQSYAGTGYPTGMLAKDICKIVLNGQALNSRYKIVPVDWGHAKGMVIRANHADKGVFDAYMSEWMKQTNVESEDRVLLKKPDIPNFHRYIKKIYLDTNTIDPADADDIIRYAERLNVQVDVTQTTKEFMVAH